MSPSRALARRLRGEDGVSAVIVTVSLAAIFGAALLSVDAGSVWKTRRALVTHTDAAALAAARYLDAAGSSGCREAVAGGRTSAAGEEAEFVLAQNDPDASLADVAVAPYRSDCDSGAGHVRVDARRKAQLAFAGIFGLDEVNAFSSSVAQYGPLAATTGLRPIGLCDKSEHYAEWKAHLAGDDSGWASPPALHERTPDGAVVHRIYFDNGSSGCGTGTGNWDWLDYNGNTPPNGNSMLKDWLRLGYPGEVSLGDDETGIQRDCNPEEGGAQESCEPKTGAGGGSFSDALYYLRDNRIVFPIMVYDKVVDDRDPEGCASPPPWDGSGDNARFCPAAILLVRLHGWQNITGALKDTSYIAMEFVDEWWIGTVGGDPAEGRPTAHGVQLCGTNYGTIVDLRCDV